MTDLLGTAPEWAERFHAAREIIREAGRMALDYFERYDTLEIEMKTSRQDLVSIADKAVERFIRAAVAERFGDDALVGEEQGLTPGGSRFCWLVDPIDGTGCFLHGLPSWGVVIAVLEDGCPVLGLIYEPCADRLYWAVAGHGAFLDGAPIRVDSKTPFDGGFIAVGASRAASSIHVGKVIEGVLAAGGIYMRNGSAALTLANVAAGRYLAFYEPILSSWDCVAGLLLVAEAGGEADDFLAGEGVLDKRYCFAATRQAAPILREIVFR